VGKIRLPDGGCVCRSSGTAKREEAQEWLDYTRAGLWRVHRLGERPTYRWQDAVVRWTEEKADKATALEDRVKFQWLESYLRGRLLHTITRDDVQAIGAAKSRETSRATANRYLALVRAVLKRAAGPWQWIALRRAANASETAHAFCASHGIAPGQRARTEMA
jgi:hypothetical protein